MPTLGFPFPIRKQVALSGEQSNVSVLLTAARPVGSGSEPQGSVHPRTCRKTAATKASSAY